MLFVTRQARDLEVHSVEEIIAGCSDSLRRYGFCCVDHVIPRDMVDAVYHELSDGLNKKLAAMTPEEKQRPGPDGKPRGMAFLGPTLQPIYSQYVCHPAIVGIAQTVLDSHVRIAQSAQRNVASDDQSADGKGGFGPLENRGPLGREWHTDWPHDLYQGANGAIRQPFADIAMCLSMVWYMTDVDEDSGGTFCVPGAHRDTRNPRGPTDGITVTAPIPGDMQCTAPAGSVFIQDSRMWSGRAAAPPKRTATALREAAQCLMHSLITVACVLAGTAPRVTTSRASSAWPARIDGCRGGSTSPTVRTLRVRTAPAKTAGSASKSGASLIDWL